MDSNLLIVIVKLDGAKCRRILFIVVDHQEHVAPPNLRPKGSASQPELLVWGPLPQHQQRPFFVTIRQDVVVAIELLGGAHNASWPMRSRCIRSLPQRVQPREGARAPSPRFPSTPDQGWSLRPLPLRPEHRASGP